MNQPEISFPASPTQLRVRRSSQSPLADTRRDNDATMDADTRRRLEQDLENIRTQEQNLLAYEMHLREWQAQLDQAQQGTRFAAPSSLTRFTIPAPQAGEGNLQEAWTKLHRARALLEIEQRHLVDDRLVLREQEALIKQREAALEAREQRIAASEQQQQRQQVALDAKPLVSSRSPFAVAKSMFGLKA
jgi:hypothetical protein